MGVVADRTQGNERDRLPLPFCLARGLLSLALLAGLLMLHALRNLANRLGGPSEGMTLDSARPHLMPGLSVCQDIASPNPRRHRTGLCTTFVLAASDEVRLVAMPRGGQSTSYLDKIPVCPLPSPIHSPLTPSPAATQRVMTTGQALQV
jgi:hypothetical protein